MISKTHQDSARGSAAEQKDAERKARAELADPDFGSPEEGESTTDDEPGT